MCERERRDTVASGMWWSAEETVMEILRDRVKKHGSQKVAAAALGVSEQYLCDVLKGRREIGDTLASALGYRRVTAFIRESR